MTPKVKAERRQRIRYTIRKKINGIAQKPRLSVFRSNSDIYVQLIDDLKGLTLAAASSRDKDINAQKVIKLKKANWLDRRLHVKRMNWD